MGHKHSHETIPSDNARPNSRTLPQIEQLAKILLEKDAKLGHQGITSKVFSNHVFPSYVSLGRGLFTYFINDVQSANEMLSHKEFCQAVDHVFAAQLNADLQVGLCLQIYGENGLITREDFGNLISLAYLIAKDHYTGSIANFKDSSKTVNAVVSGAFHGKGSLSHSYVSQWISNNCPRLLDGMYRYIVHCLSTSYRQGDSGSALGATTPVLDEDTRSASLPLAEVWILAMSLPEVFSRPSIPPRSAASNGLAGQSAIARMVGAICPSHWTALYRSNEDGLAASRFQHNVMGYRGPTIMVLVCEGSMQFCLATTSEWHESNLFWGSSDTTLLQVQPEFHCLEKNKEKTLYFNSTIRGYPLGIRAGSNPKHPILNIDGDLNQLTYLGAPYELYELQVWGCASEHVREAQLNLKRLQMKDADNARKVTINAEDWTDNPDRYILELAGHRSYRAESSSKSEKS